VSYESAIQQWREGERRLHETEPPRVRVLERVADLAVAAAPADPWAWDARVAVDAAFARYLREASDYAGGRRLTPGG
jgi:hypothetical protein